MNASAFLYYRLDTFEGYVAPPTALHDGDDRDSVNWKPLIPTGTGRTLLVGDFAQTQEDVDGEGLLFVPSSLGPLSTLHLESLRDGLEDHSYFDLLRTLLHKAGAQGVALPPNDTLASIVEDSLFRELQPAAQVDSVDGAFATNPAVLRAKRVAVAKAILSVQQKLSHKSDDVDGFTLLPHSVQPGESRRVEPLPTKSGASHRWSSAPTPGSNLVCAQRKQFMALSWTPTCECMRAEL
jgi:hypothetical protein